MRRNVGMAGAICLTIACAAAPAARADEWDQIAALQRIKASLTPAERKLDSRLAVQLKQGASSGTREVDIRGDVPVAKLRDLGATIRAASKRSVRAMVPVSALEQIARWPGVKRVDEAVGAKTAVIRPPGWTPSKPADESLRRGRRGRLRGRRARTPPTTARATTRVTGVGVKVCALSDGVDSLARLAGRRRAARRSTCCPARPAPATRARRCSRSSTTSRRARSSASRPRSRATASFADNIRALRFDAGCDVIVDDVIYFNESPFQDGPIAQAVNAVTADGALLLQLRRQRGQHARRHVRQLRGRLRRLRPAASASSPARRTTSIPGPACRCFSRSPTDSAGVADHALLGRSARRGAATTTTSTCSTAPARSLAFSQDVQDGDDDPYELLRMPTVGGSGCASRSCGSPATRATSR